MRVFKYRGGGKATLKRDLASLARSQVYLAPIDTLNDPFEAQVKINGESFEIGKFLKMLPTFKYNENIKIAEGNFINTISKFIEASKSWGIYSLSKSHKDELLWAYYADSHRGFCIEYDLEILKKYQIEHEPSIDVEYQECIPTIEMLDMLALNDNQQLLQKKIIATKSKHWKHENEIRIVTGRTGLYDYDYRALKAIYFGHRSEEKFRKLTMRLLKGRSIKYYLMKPEKGAYNLERHELEDLYHSAPKYMENVAKVEAGVPYLDEKITPFENLINSAIEIVRREPYCRKITDAYLSGSKGTPDNPVFYITYERNDGAIRNFFISKNEILLNGS